MNNKRKIMMLAVVAAFMMLVVPIAITANASDAAIDGSEIGTSYEGPIDFSAKIYGHTDATEDKFATNDTLGNNLTVTATEGSNGVWAYVVTGNFGGDLSGTSSIATDDAKAVWESYGSGSYKYGLVIYASNGEKFAIKGSNDSSTPTAADLGEGHIFYADADWKTSKDPGLSFWQLDGSTMKKVATIKIDIKATTAEKGLLTLNGIPRYSIDTPTGVTVYTANGYNANPKTGGVVKSLRDALTGQADDQIWVFNAGYYNVTKVTGEKDIQSGDGVYKVPTFASAMTIVNSVKMVGATANDEPATVLYADYANNYITSWTAGGYTANELIACNADNKSVVIENMDIMPIVYGPSSSTWIDKYGPGSDEKITGFNPAEHWYTPNCVISYSCNLELTNVNIKANTLGKQLVPDVYDGESFTYYPSYMMDDGGNCQNYKMNSTIYSAENPSVVKFTNVTSCGGFSFNKQFSSVEMVNVTVNVGGDSNGDGKSEIGDQRMLKLLSDPSKDNTNNVKAKFTKLQNVVFNVNPCDKHEEVSYGHNLATNVDKTNLIAMMLSSRMDGQFPAENLTSVTINLNTNSVISYDVVIPVGFTIVNNGIMVVNSEKTLTNNGAIINDDTISIIGTVVNRGAIANTDVVIGTGSLTFSGAGTLSIGSTGVVDVVKIDFTASTSSVKVITIKQGGKITALLDGSDGAEKISVLQVTGITAGVGGITVTKGSVYINGAIATADAEGTITIPPTAPGSVVYVSGTVEEGVKVVVPAGTSVVVPKETTLTFEKDSALEYEAGATIAFEDATASIVYEKGSTVNDVEIEVETKETSEGTITAIKIYFVSENEKKLVVNIDYVEVLPGKTYGDAMFGVTATPVKKNVTFDGWYNLAFGEKVRTGDIVGNYDVTLTACYTEEKVVPVIPDRPGQSTVTTEDGTVDYALPAAFILLVVSIFALGFVILKKRN